MPHASAFPAVPTLGRGGQLVGLVLVLLCSLVLLRFALNANVLDNVIKYSAEGGSIVEKIHPSTYGLTALLAVLLVSFRIELGAWELRVLRSLLWLIGIIVSLSAFMAAAGRSGSAGYLIDSYVSACIAGFLMLAVPPALREKVGTVLIAFVTLSALVALGEVASQRRLLPYWATESSFRPTGLTEHPLMLGLFNATVISFVPLTRWHPIAKVAAIAVLLLSTLASGARLASLGALASAFAVLLLSEWPSVPRRKVLQLKLLALIGAATAVPIGLLALLQLGLLDRFQEGLFDDSAMARVNIYGLFGLASWNELLWGADIAYMRRLAFEHFELEYIESSLVMFVFQFGLIGAAVFLAFLARTFVVLSAGGGSLVTLGTCMFFVMASSNNALSSKSPNVLLITLLIIAFHHCSRAGRTAIPR
ncbi:MAG: hypothetical protein IT537_20585 [Hyphomicrobiales bacterium]|nr:hypothetical protein [Hyphomicrobiales bacterium]